MYINLKEIYSFIYSCDIYVDIPDEVANLLLKMRREDKAAARQRERYKADLLPYIEGVTEVAGNCRRKVLSSEDLYLQDLEEKQLIKAFLLLTEKEQRRVYKHFVLRMGYSDVASSEGVHESSVRESIKNAIKKMKKTFK